MQNFEDDMSGPHRLVALPGTEEVQRQIVILHSNVALCSSAPVSTTEFLLHGLRTLFDANVCLDAQMGRYGMGNSSEVFFRMNLVRHAVRLLTRLVKIRDMTDEDDIFPVDISYYSAVVSTHCWLNALALEDLGARLVCPDEPFLAPVPPYYQYKPAAHAYNIGSAYDLPVSPLEITPLDSPIGSPLPNGFDV